MSFVKLDCGMLDSSIWGDRDAKDVFITSLLMARPFKLDKNTPALERTGTKKTGFVVPADWYGFIKAADTGIVRRSGLDMDSGLAALERLCAPEPNSSSTAYEGRRMARIDEGYLVLNYEKYRSKDHTAAKRAWHYRDRKRNKQSRVTNVTVTQAEAEAEAEANREVPQIPSPKAPVARRKRVKPLEASETQPALITFPAETNASLPVAAAQTAPPSASPQDSPKVDDHNKLRMQFIEDFCSAFKARFAVDYTFDGGRDGAAVKKLLSRGLEPVQILDTAKKAWDNGSFYAKHARTLHGLNNYYTQINVEVNGKDTNALLKTPARVDRNAGTCNENIDHDKFAAEVKAYNEARYLRRASEETTGLVP